MHRIYIGEHGCCPLIGDASNRTDPGTLRRNHLVALADPKAGEKQMKRRGAVRRHQSIFTIVITRKFGLERFDIMVGILAIPTVAQGIEHDFFFVLGDPRSGHLDVRRTDVDRIFTHRGYFALRQMQALTGPNWPISCGSCAANKLMSES